MRMLPLTLSCLLNTGMVMCALNADLSIHISIINDTIIVSSIAETVTRNFRL